MKKLIHLFVSCTLLVSFSALASVTVPANALNGVDLKSLAGTYSNKLGFKTTIRVKETDRQLDLFKPSDLSVTIGGEYEFFEGDKGFYLNSSNIKFKEVNSDKDVVFTIDEDCDYNVCTESEGTITLKKKNDGGYYLNIQLQTEYQDLEEGAIEIERLASKGVKNPALAYCKGSYPKIVSSNFTVVDKDLGICEARVMFFMKKD